MSTFTPHKPPVKPQTSINWAGQPYSPEKGESYHGDVTPPKPLKVKEVKVKVPMTEERKEKLRLAMAHARNIMRMRREERARDTQSTVPPSKGLSSKALAEDDTTG